MRAVADGEKEIRQIDDDIRKSTRRLWIWVGACSAVYLGWFLLWKFGYVDSANSPSNGGVLGDYFGGLVNPVVAFAAFFWLTRGVRLQKEELAETRQSLQEQAAYARTSVRIDALSSMIAAHTSDITYRREHLAFLMSQKVHKTANAYYSMRGKVLDGAEFEKLVRDLNEGIRVRAAERVRFGTELHALLKASRSSAESSELRQMALGPDSDDDGAP